MAKNKKLSSLTFSFQKIYEKILNFKPSLFIIAAVAVAFSVFLFGGAIYDILEQPGVAYLARTGRIQVFSPFGITDQTLLASIVVMITIVI